MDLAVHKFHIPVMGLAYTIDSPVKVARFGIASVVSIVEDRLVEMMRSHYYPLINQTYHPITSKEEDYRAKRITDYLNLLNKIVQMQVEKLRSAAFEAGSEIVKYFEMLPDDGRLKQLYRKMLAAKECAEKENLQAYLRRQIIAGSIDVNIMTKTDRNNFSKQGELLEDGSDAVAALRGYAKSDLSDSSVIFSAGMNPRLYNYLEKLEQFNADENGIFKKKIIVKVSDYRSALIQGKYLAKKGVWVSEYRVESGLNCGGHAFATDGYLLGPIMEEFRQKKAELKSAVFDLYRNALQKKDLAVPVSPPPVDLSVQGGIGTAEEDCFLRKQYGVNSTGWGTPFLLVPEATTVDEATLQLLCKAKESDVVLSHNSPLGVRFHYLKGTSSEKEKLDRIQKQKPGSPCTEKHLQFNTEFTGQPICTASYKYQKLKIAQLQSRQLSEIEYQKQLSNVLDKECLCIGLSNAAAVTYKKTFIKNLEAVTICPGPNIAHFSRIVSLQTMIDHIYGRTSVIENNSRPHMFIAELRLYINYLKQEVENDAEPNAKKKNGYKAFCQNLLKGIAYYCGLKAITIHNRQEFYSSLNEARILIEALLGSMGEEDGIIAE
jgi:hypothetical protein